jgi:hypothetical protein
VQRCFYCGAELPPNAGFCGQCGQLQPRSYGGDPNAETALTHPGTPGPAAPETSGPGASKPTVYAAPPSLSPPTLPAQPSWQTQESVTPPPPPPPLVYLDMPPPLPASPPPAARPRRGLLLPALIVVLCIALVAGGFLVYHGLSTPALQPSIQVTSAYHVGVLPAGSQGTSLQVSGTQFAPSTLVTFLLDGRTLPGAQVESNTVGGINKTLTITSAWAVGQHQLTAVDANNNRTERGASLLIVPQGEAGTPGPHNAPSDSASFHLSIVLQGKTQSGESISRSGTMTVTGHPDPAGGSVCIPADDQRPHTTSTINSGVNEQLTYTATCQGTYKTGQLTFREIVTQDKAVFSNGLTTVTCVAPTPLTDLNMQGSFTSHTTIQGTFNWPTIVYTCDNGSTINTTPAQGTWTGQLIS